MFNYVGSTMADVLIDVELGNSVHAHKVAGFVGTVKTVRWFTSIVGIQGKFEYHFYNKIKL